MRILLLGASGFIGSAILARLISEGHEVMALVRRAGAADHLPASSVIQADIARATAPEDWFPHLSGIDAVVNCAGVLQEGPGDSVAGVHHRGIDALFSACERAGVRRVIHFSAIGADAPLTEFSRSKLAGDEALMARDLDWTILRPSVVVGSAAYGGSALFRGLAALPILPIARETGPLQIVSLDDVVETVVALLRNSSPPREILEIAGPERLSFADVVARYRRWLGWRPARVFVLPDWVAAAMYRSGDLVGSLGWRAPIRTTARREVVRGATGDPARWTQATGIQPRSLSAVLQAHPASVQERWFSKLYFLKPVIFGVLSLFWITTGLISLGPGWDIGVGLMREGGAGWLSEPSVIAGALADIAIGIGIAFRRTARMALYAAFLLSVTYIVIGTAILPRLWEEPLGPMLKIWPILALNLVALAILEDR